MKRKTVTLQIRVNPEVKKEAEEILSSLGISLSSAIRMFLHQIVNSRGMPFTPNIEEDLNEKVDSTNQI